MATTATEPLREAGRQRARHTKTEVEEPSDNSSGEAQNEHSNLTDCENSGNIWTGIYTDEALENLKGLWRFNYNSPRFEIYDESCIELNLDSGISGLQKFKQSLPVPFRTGRKNDTVASLLAKST